MKKLKYIFIALCFAACQAESVFTEEATPLLHTRASALQIAQTDNLNLKDLGIINPTKLARKDSLYVLLTPKNPYRFVVYNLNTGKLRRLVPAGQGENEGLYYLTLNINGNIVSSFDFGMGRLVEIDLSRCNDPEYVPVFTSLTNGDKTPLGAIRAGEQLISTGLYTEGRYCCTNPDGADYFSVTYPECVETTLSDTLKSVFFASNCLATNPEQTKLACANMQTGCLDICNIEDQQLRRVNEVHLTRPGVAFRHKRPKGNKLWFPVAYKESNLFGFCDITTSTDYIFALYSGRTYRQHKNDVDKGRTILVFDWNGSHVRTYHLPNLCSSISYDRSTNTIYALSHENKKKEIITLNL